MKEDMIEKRMKENMISKEDGRGNYRLNEWKRTWKIKRMKEEIIDKEDEGHDR